MRVAGRFASASNTTLLVELELAAGGTGHAVYKPTRGTRELWDFEAETLARHEVAASRLAEEAAARVPAHGPPLVPLTVLRPDGPYGEGAVQVFVPTRGDEDAVDIFASGALPETGWRVVFAAEDLTGHDVIVAHRDTARLRRMALLDEAMNNADRKGQHILTRLEDGELVGIDHGLCFHVDDKLRTVLWGFAGEDFDAADLSFLEALDDAADSLSEEFTSLIGDDENVQLGRRIARATARGAFADPPMSRHAIPWPPL